MLLKGCIPDNHDDMTPAPPGKKPKKNKTPIVVEDELSFISQPDFIYPSDDTSLLQSDADLGTSEGEGLSDGPASTLSDFVHPEGKPYALHTEG